MQSMKGWYIKMNENATIPMETMMPNAPIPPEPVREITYGNERIRVLSLYPYRYDYGKGRTVLRIDIPEENVTLEQLAALKANTGAVDYYEDDVLKASYEGFTADFTYTYSGGSYSVELQRVGETEAAVLANAAEIRRVSEIAEQAAADAAYAAIMMEG